MNLSNDLISEFAKLASPKTDTKKESIVYGTAIKDGDTTYVKIDGSDRWTPVSTSAVIKSEDKENGERVTLLVKDHSATIIGNTSTPAARSDDVSNMGTQIHELDIIMSYKVNTDDLTAINATITNLMAITGKYQDLTAVTAKIETLMVKFAELDYVSAKDIEAITAEIDVIKSLVIESSEITTDDLTAVNAEIGHLEGHTANFTYVSTELLRAFKASIENLDVNKLSAEEANLKYVNIDFANIDQAWMNELFAKSGIIQSLESEDGSFTGELVSVLVKGDLIEAGTLKVDRLVIRGTDGNYYQLNTDFSGLESVTPVTEDMIHGSVMVAESITADKIRVSDLSAFRATIGGFHIGDGESGPRALYSDVKNSVNNTTRGIFLDAEGEFNFGDANNYIKFYKVVDADGNDVLDENGRPTYRLTISAESILFGQDKSSTADLKARMDKIKMGSYVDEETGETHPYIELGGEDPAVNFVASGFTDSDFGYAVSRPFYLERGKTYKYEITTVDGLAPNVIVAIEGWNPGYNPAYGWGSNTIEFTHEHSSDNYCVYIYGPADNIASASFMEIRGANAPTIFKQRLTNKQAIFSDDDTPTIIDSDGVDTENVIVRGELRQGGLAWTTRQSGKYIHYGLMWKGVTS